MISIRKTLLFMGLIGTIITSMHATTEKSEQKVVKITESESAIKTHNIESLKKALTDPDLKINNFSTLW